METRRNRPPNERPNRAIEQHLAVRRGGQCFIQKHSRALTTRPIPWSIEAHNVRATAWVTVQRITH